MKLLKKLRPDPLLYEICAELGMFVMLPIITSLLWVLITPLLILGARGIGLIQNDHGIHSWTLYLVFWPIAAALALAICFTLWHFLSGWRALLAAVGTMVLVAVLLVMTGRWVESTSL